MEHQRGSSAAAERRARDEQVDACSRSNQQHSEPQHAVPEVPRPRMASTAAPPGGPFSNPNSAEAPADATAYGDPSRVWLPEIVSRIAIFLDANVVPCTLRLVDRATAALLRHTTTVRLSQPSPPREFARRWCSPAVLRRMTWKQRRRLLRLTAAAGCLINLDALLSMEQYLPLGIDVMSAAAAAGHLDVCHWLRHQGCPVGQAALTAAAGGGHWEVCEWLLGLDTTTIDDTVDGTDGCVVSVGVVAAAARGGHADLVRWLLKLRQLPRPGRDGPEGEAAPAAAAPSVALLDWHDAATLLEAVAEGCDLATLQKLHAEWMASGVPQQEQQPGQQQRQQQRLQERWRLAPHHVSDIMAAAAASPTPDWRAKLLWSYHQLHCGGSVVGVGAAGVGTGGGGVGAPAAAAPWPLREVVAARVPERMEDGGAEAVARLCWLRPSLRCPVGQLVVASAAAAGNVPALEYLLSDECAVELEHLFRTRLYLGATKGGHLDALKVLAERYGAVPYGAVLQVAARAGHTHIVTWAVRHAPPEVLGQLSKEFKMDDAAASGDVKLMEWLQERGFGDRVGPGCYCAAAVAGCEEALEWLADHGCPIQDSSTYLNAAWRGDTSTLCCLRRLGCPLGVGFYNFRHAVMLVHSKCKPGSDDSCGADGDGGVGRADGFRGLTWLLQAGCPVNWDAAKEVAGSTGGHSAHWLLEWLEDEERRWVRGQEGAQEDEEEY